MFPLLVAITLCTNVMACVPTGSRYCHRRPNAVDGVFAVLSLVAAVADVASMASRPPPPRPVQETVRVVSPSPPAPAAPPVVEPAAEIPAESPTPTIEPGTIEGFVVSEGTRFAMPWAVIEVVGNGKRYLTKTNARGRFRITGPLLPGAYQVRLTEERWEGGGQATIGDQPSFPLIVAARWART